MGPFFALFAATAFAIASAAIAKGSKTGRGDNGAFLSVILTAIASATLWLLLGQPLDVLGNSSGMGVLCFVASGMLATVIGRLALFRSVALAGAIRASLFRRLIPFFAAIFAFIILGETIGWITGAGMAVIIASLVLVLSVRAGPAALERPATPAPSVRRGEMFGAVSAASYGASLVARKLGMIHIPDPALGTFIGAVTGLCWYCAAATVSRSYRAVIRDLVRDTGRWQFLAAGVMSLGQLAQFFALMTTDVAVVAIIGSLEVFLGIYIAAYVFRTEPPPGKRILAASVVATIGVVLVAVG